MIHLGYHGVYAVRCAHISNVRAVAGHHYTCSATAQSTLRYPHDHGQARNVGQWFVGQAAGTQPGGDKDGEGHSGRGLLIKSVRTEGVEVLAQKNES